jgi:hypothetical protein
MLCSNCLEILVYVGESYSKALRCCGQSGQIGRKHSSSSLRIVLIKDRGAYVTD